MSRDKKLQHVGIHMLRRAQLRQALHSLRNQVVDKTSRVPEKAASMKLCRHTIIP